MLRLIAGEGERDSAAHGGRFAVWTAVSLWGW